MTVDEVHKLWVECGGSWQQNDLVANSAINLVRFVERIEARAKAETLNSSDFVIKVREAIARGDFDNAPEAQGPL